MTAENFKKCPECFEGKVLNPEKEYEADKLYDQGYFAWGDLVLKWGVTCPLCKGTGHIEDLQQEISISYRIREKGENNAVTLKLKVGDNLQIDIHDSIERSGMRLIQGDLENLSTDELKARVIILEGALKQLVRNYKISKPKTKN